MFRFAEPEYLYLLFIIPLLVVFFVASLINKKKNIKAFGNPEFMAQFMPDVSRFRPYVKFLLCLLAIVLIIFVMARPQFGTKLESTKRHGIELMVALDISNSMLAEDVSPNRLERSKQILSNLVDGLHDDKIGLVVFAGRAYTQLPITTDMVSAKMFLSSISPNLIAQQGTAVGAAIDLCMHSFKPDTDVSKAIVIITDGENHEEDAIAKAKEAAALGIKIYVIGMGKPEGSPIPAGDGSFFKDRAGNVVVSRLNEDMCRQIAMIGQGVYARANNSNGALKEVQKELDKLAKAELESYTYSQYKDQYQGVLWVALLLLVIEFFLLERRNRKLSKKLFN